MFVQGHMSVDVTEQNQPLESEQWGPDSALLLFFAAFILAEDTKLTFILPPRRPVNDAPGHWLGFSGCLVYSNSPAFLATLQSVKW